MSADNSTLVVPQFPEIVGVEFRLIPGFPGYAADSEGRIWSCRKRRDWKALAPAKTPKGYYHVHVRRNGQGVTSFVHVLVLLAFHGPRPDGLIARHYPDSTKTNNRPSNLSWTTPSQNTLDSVAEGTHYGFHVAPHTMGIQKGSKNGCAKLNEEIVVQLRTEYKYGARATDLAARYGIADTTVLSIVNRKTWKHI